MFSAPIASRVTVFTATICHISPVPNRVRHTPVQCRSHYNPEDHISSVLQYVAAGKGANVLAVLAIWGFLSREQAWLAASWNISNLDEASIKNYGGNVDIAGQGLQDDMKQKSWNINLLWRLQDVKNKELKHGLYVRPVGMCSRKTWKRHANMWS